MVRVCCAGACALFAVSLALPAAGAPIIFATQEDELFRVDNGLVHRFFLSNAITALDFDDNGVLWGVGTDEDNDDLFELYQINDPFGSPTLTLISEGLTRQTTSIVWDGRILYGIQGQNIDPPQTLVTIDPATGSTSPVGATGNTGINPEQVGGITIKNNVMWALNSRLPGHLLTIDHHLTNGPEPTATLAHTTNPLLALLTNGLDVDPESGQMWAMIRKANLIGSDIGLYTVDETTGQLTLELDLSSLTSARGSSGLAIIPEPGTAVVVILGGLSVFSHGRQRRRS